MKTVGRQFPATRAPLVVLGMVTLLGCGGAEPTVVPPVPASGMSIVSGGGATDTVGATLAQALVVKVLDKGVPAAGVAVRFVASPAPALPYYRFVLGRIDRSVEIAAPLTTQFDSVATVTTDAGGNASVAIRFGHRATPSATITASAATLGTSIPATYNVQPVAAQQLLVNKPDGQAYVGNGYPIGAVVVDRWTNVRPDQVTYSTTGGVVSVDASGTVTARQTGRAVVRLAVGTFRDSAMVSVPPRGVILANVNDTLVRFELDGSNYRAIAPVTQGHWRSGSASWGPAGSILLVDAANGKSSFVLIDSAGASRPIPSPGGVQRVGLGRFSPDGQWIYFSAQRTASIVWDLWRMRPDGASAQLLQPGLIDWGDSWWISIAPDGRSIAVLPGVVSGTIPGTIVYNVNPWAEVGRAINVYPAAFNRAGDALLGFGGDGLYTMAADARNAGPYLDGNFSLSVSFSPDGDWFVVTGFLSGPMMQVVNYRTKVVIPLHYSFRMNWPEWRP